LHIREMAQRKEGRRVGVGSMISNLVMISNLCGDGSPQGVA